jgi:phage terminase large subunit GpA-like protein
MFVDSGDGTTTPYVYEWIRTQPRPRVWAIKGDKRCDTPVGPPKSVELTISGKKLKYGVLFRIVNSDYFKAGFYADLRKRAPSKEEREQNGMGYPQGYCHFPIDDAYGDEHFKQVCSEQLITHRDQRGRQKTEWQQTRPRNEGLDKLIYAMAAAWDFGAHRFQPKHWAMLREKVKDLAPAEIQPGQPVGAVGAVGPVRLAPSSQPQRRVIRSRFMN